MLSVTEARTVGKATHTKNSVLQPNKKGHQNAIKMLSETGSFGGLFLFCFYAQEVRKALTFTCSGAIM